MSSECQTFRLSLEIAQPPGIKQRSGAAARREITQDEADRKLRDLGVMVNAGGRVPIDESPSCYKPAGEVIRAVTEAGLAEVEVCLSPIASIKGED